MDLVITAQLTDASGEQATGSATVQVNVPAPAPAEQSPPDIHEQDAERSSIQAWRSQP